MPEELPDLESGVILQFEGTVKVAADDLEDPHDTQGEFLDVFLPNFRLWLSIWVGVKI